HDEVDARETIARERKRDHRPGPSTPRKGGVRHVLVLGKRRHERIAQPQKMFSGDRVVGDDESGLTIDERDWTAEAPLPEHSAIGFTRRCRVTEGGERPGGVYLLCPE